MIRPCVSQNGHLIAWISPNGGLQVSVLPLVHEQAATTTLVTLASSIQAVLPKVRHMRWSCEAYVNHVSNTAKDEAQQKSLTKSSLMLAAEHRLIVLEFRIPTTPPDGVEVGGVLVDVSFPIFYGNISAMEFIFDHESALIIFEMASHASILSLRQAQCNDIPDRKYSTAQGYALLQSAKAGSEHTVLAMLARHKYTDQVVIVEKGKVVSSFSPETLDAQSLLWSPNRRPLITVWDSSVYGTKLKFFSALGHPLRQLDIGPGTSIHTALGLDFVGAGVSGMDWTTKLGSRTVTMLAFGGGSKQILLRSQDTQSFALEQHFFQLPDALDSSKTTIWQHCGYNNYSLQVGVWDLEMGYTGDVLLIAISPDGQRLASKVEGATNIVLVWEIGHEFPIAAIIMQKDVRQLIWTESFSKLIIITADTEVSFHYWYGIESSPLQITPSQLQGMSSSSWKAQLLGGKSRLMLASPKYFDVFQLDDATFPSVFESRHHVESSQVASCFESSSKATNDSNETHQNTAIEQSTTNSDSSSIFF